MFNFFKRKKTINTVKYNKDAEEYCIAVQKLIDIMTQTTIPTRFFSLYSRSLDLLNIVFNLNPDDTVTELALSLQQKLLNPDITNSFFDRCKSNGTLDTSIDEIITYKNLMSKKSYDYFLQLSELNYRQYIYCSVTFESNKSYFYICEFEEIYPGDIVVVPVGDNNEEKIATVVDVAIFRYDEVPYPVNKTKTIISKIGE